MSPVNKPLAKTTVTTRVCLASEPAALGMMGIKPVVNLSPFHTFTPADRRCEHTDTHSYTDAPNRSSWEFSVVRSQNKLNTCMFWRIFGRIA